MKLRNINLEMLQCAPDSVVVDRSRHIVRGGERLVACVAHRHARACGPQHRHVVAAVAESHRLAVRKAEMRGELGHARRLVDTPDIDVRENRAPARRHERRQFGHHPLFEFGIEIKAHLATERHYDRNCD